MGFLHGLEGLRQSGARASIAPEVETFLGAGPSYAVPGQPTSDLEVNVLLLRSKDRKPLLLLVSIDALYVGRKLRNVVDSKFAAVLEPEQVIISASHSHFAPMLDDTKPFLGSVVDAHFDRVSRIVTDCISRALEDDESVEVTLKHSRYKTNTSIYRRRLVPFLPRGRKVEWMRSQFLPNRFRKLDVESDVIEFWSDEGVVGALWVMPCHPVGYPVQEKATSEFIGTVRNYWRELAAGSGPLPFVFIQGASGDLRPPAIRFRPWNHLESIVVNLVFGRTFGSFSPLGWETWVADVREEFSQALASGAKPLSGEMSVQRWLSPLDRFFEKNWEGERNFSVHYLRLGSLELLCLSGEVTWLCRGELLKELGRPGMVVGGCIDDCFGYLASPSQARWGGYEVDGFLKFFSLRPVRLRFQAAIIELVSLSLESVPKLEPDRH